MIQRFLKGFCFFTIAMLVLCTQSIGVQAQSTSGLRAIFSDTPYFDANSTEECIGQSSATSGTKLTGGKVYILGDSITVSAKAQYESVFSSQGLTAVVNASSSRSITGPGDDKLTGLEAIEADKSVIAGSDVKAIVVALGSNGNNSAENVRNVITALRAHSQAKIYWVDTIAIGRSDYQLGTIKRSNIGIYTEAATGNITPISWFKTVDPDADPQNPTGDEKDINGYVVNANVHVHLTSVGVDAIVNLVSKTVINNASPSSQMVVAGGCSCSVEVATLLNGNDNFEKTWNFFLGKGLSANAIAGMMGNLMAESGNNPQNIQSGAPFPDGPEMPTQMDKLTGQLVPNSSIAGKYGYGIMQWTTVSRQQGLIETAKKLGKLTGDLDVQLEHIWFELGTKYFDDVLAKLQEPGVSLNDASDKVALDYATPRSVIFSSDYSPDVNEARRQKTLNSRRSLSQNILAKYSGLTPSSALSSSGSCANITGPGEDTKYVDGFTIYSQLDKAWKDEPYGSSTIELSGCAPAAMAMIITNLTGKPVSPSETTKYADQQNLYNAESKGSNGIIGPVLAEHWGLKAKPFSDTVSNEHYLHNDIQTITAALQAGALIIAPGVGAKPFSKQGHYIVIRGVTSSGKFKVADAWFTDTADKEWDPEQILSQVLVGGMYAITK